MQATNVFLACPPLQVALELARGAIQASRNHPDDGGMKTTGSFRMPQLQTLQRVGVETKQDARGFNSQARRPWSFHVDGHLAEYQQFSFWFFPVMVHG